MVKRLNGALSMIVVFGLAAPASADWPMARHDRMRTGVADGAGRMTDPTPYFRHYLGGSLSASQMLTRDIDGDGAEDVLMLTGGRVVARTVEDTDLWSSPPRGFSRLVGLFDLDGDGVEELVVHSSSQVFVLNPRDGSELWAEPPGEMGTIGGTRIGDFDDDGSIDLLIAECACCGVNSGYPGAVYTFTDGFAAARHLWEIPAAYCGYSRAITVMDADGVGAPELVLPTATTIRIYRPTTGEIVAESPSIGPRAYWQYCTPRQLDADPEDELVCLMMTSNSSVVDRWRVTTFDITAPGTLSILWSTVLAPDATGGMRVLDPVVDLDADGAVEIVIAVSDSGVWETRIYDALSGTLEDTLPDTIAVGHIATATGRQLVTRSDTALQGWSYAGATATATWSLAGHDVFTGWDFDDAGQRSLPSVMVTPDLDGDGRADLLATEPTATSSRLVAYSIDGATATELASYDLAPGTETQAAWVTPPLTTSAATIAVSYSDGFMVIHDSMLRPAFGGGEFEFATLRTGGYYAAGGWRDLSRTPVTAALEAAAPEAVLVGDARGALLRLDASEASWATGPRVVWERLYTSTPSIVNGLVDGSRAIACFAVRDPGAEAREHDLAVLTPDGAVRWSVAVDSSPLLDIVPGNFDGDSVPDLVFHWGEPSNTLLRTRAVSGTDGSTLWEATPLEPGSGRQAAGISVGAFDGDGRDDVYFQGAGTRVLSGADGAQLAALGGPSYFLPSLANIDGDPQLEVILHAGYSPVRVAEHDLSALTWTSADDDRPYPYGSIVECAPDRTVLVSGSWAHRSRLKITELRGTLGTESVLFLASGARYASAADVEAAGAFGGQLTSSAVHANLAGDGAPAALVGSTDGWLYWINPCDGGSLVHATDFGVAVGQPVFGDTDRDGFDEILVSAADGYLYGIKQRHAASPEWVIDVDPATPASVDDADFVTTMDTLMARWAPVTGAIRYEVGAFEADGTPLLAGRWQDVGMDTEVILTGLPLADAGFYYVGVRAWSADGPSVDVVTDGVVVRFPSPGMDAGPMLTDAGADAGSTGGDAGPTDPPADGGCGCRASADGRWSPFLAALAVMALLWLRRRR